MLKEIDEDKIIKILEKVQLSQFIKNNKLANSFIGENANYLSGGEKQRLAIARAFYKESSLLIFDEITNKLDKKTSDKIMSLINSLKGDKTIIIVSHNVNNLTNTNYNLSLENNKILKIK
jgi:ABC-type transport system involved in cytochrome bd biosynthesis fused ATPase/permease subunit